MEKSSCPIDNITLHMTAQLVPGAGGRQSSECKASVKSTQAAINWDVRSKYYRPPTLVCSPPRIYLLLQFCGTPVLMVPPIPSNKTIVMLCDSLEHESCPCFLPPPPAFLFLCLGGKCLSLLLLPLSLHVVPTTHAQSNDQMGILVRALRLTCVFNPT